MAQPRSVSLSLLAANARRSVDADSKTAGTYRVIKDMIVSLELPPAALIDERGLAERLGVGLTPVRLALRRLQWESLVVILPRRGTLVADLNDSDLQRIYEMRAVLEPLAAAQAAKLATAEQKVVLVDLISRTRVALAADRPDSSVLLALDRELHRLLWSMASNPMLEQTLEWIFSHVLRRWNAAIGRVGDLPVAIADHLPIAAAVLAGDAGMAQRQMTAHVDRFQRAMERI